MNYVQYLPFEMVLNMTVVSYIESIIKESMPSGITINRDAELSVVA